MPTLAAQADEADCADSLYATGGYEFFDVDPRFVPPPMRGTAWDCAFRIADRDFDETLLPGGGYARSIQYTFLYVDMTFEQLIDFYRAFERSGYAQGNQITIVATEPGQNQTGGFSIEEVAALDPRPGYVHARFSNGENVPEPSTRGSNIYEFTWTDGVDFESASGIDGRSQLFASVLLTEPFGKGTALDDPSTLSDLQPIYAPTGVQWGVIAGGSLMLMLVVGLALDPAQLGRRIALPVDRARRDDAVPQKTEGVGCGLGREGQRADIRCCSRRPRPRAAVPVARLVDVARLRVGRHPGCLRRPRLRDQPDVAAPRRSRCS